MGETNDYLETNWEELGCEASGMDMRPDGLPIRYIEYGNRGWKKPKAKKKRTKKVVRKVHGHKRAGKRK